MFAPCSAHYLSTSNDNEFPCLRFFGYVRIVFVNISENPSESLVKAVSLYVLLLM